jgi:prepilin-type N-terminal cleavage/methylation domain-containing protein
MQKNRLRRGFSLIELLIVIAIILIIAAIAVPKMNKQIMAAHEMAAIRMIGTIHTCETQYYSQFGHYAQNLSELGPPASGAAGPAAADLLQKNLADGKASGFLFTVTGTPTGYSVSAVPETFGSSGGRTFFSDQTLVIRNNYTAEPATAASPEIR